MNGTVTISLEDFKLLEKGSAQAQKEKTLLVAAAKELEVFLSFLINKIDMDEHIEEFNKYSKQSQIAIIDGKAKIKLTGFGVEED